MRADVVYSSPPRSRDQWLTRTATGAPRCGTNRTLRPLFLVDVPEDPLVRVTQGAAGGVRRHVEMIALLCAVVAIERLRERELNREHIELDAFVGIAASAASELPVV